MSDWHFEWLTTWDQVWSPMHVERWQLHLNRCQNSHVFSTIALVRAWWTTAKEVCQVESRFLWAESTEGAQVFMPLVLARHGYRSAFLRVLQPAGHAEFDYHDPIGLGLDHEVWQSFWCALRQVLHNRWGSECDRLVIGGLRRSPLIEASTIVDQAPYLRIDEIDSPDALLNSLGKSLRGDIRRQMRRLEGLGPVSYRVLDTSELDTALSWLPAMLEQHAEKWPNSYKLPGFHAQLVSEALPAGLLHISELTAGDAVVSRHLGFCYKQRFYWYMPVYDTAYQSYSPGKLHLYHCAIDAIDRGCEVFDLLRGVEEYKQQWTDKSSQLYELNWCGTSPGTALRLLLAEKVKPALKRLWG